MYSNGDKKNIDIKGECFIKRIGTNTYILYSSSLLTSPIYIAYDSSIQYMILDTSGNQITNGSAIGTLKDSTMLEPYSFIKVPTLNSPIFVSTTGGIQFAGSQILYYPYSLGTFDFTEATYYVAMQVGSVRNAGTIISKWSNSNNAFRLYMASNLMNLSVRDSGGNVTTSTQTISTLTNYVFTFTLRSTAGAVYIYYKNAAGLKSTTLVNNVNNGQNIDWVIGGTANLTTNVADSYVNTFGGSGLIYEIRKYTNIIHTSTQILAIVTEIQNKFGI